MPRKTKRDEELSSRAAISKRFMEVLNDVKKAVSDQQDRTDDIIDNWDIYNSIYSGKQFYNGNSQVYISIVADAVNARRTRFVNQLFPQTGRCVEVTSENEDVPQATMALLDHYVRATRLRNEIVPPLFVMGDVEGQYTVYVGWAKTTRRVVHKVQKPIVVDGLEQPDLGETEDVEEEEVEEGAPYVELIPDADLLVLPATANSIDDALEQGGSVSIVRRWRKAKIKKLIADGEIIKAEGDALIKAMDKVADGDRPDTAKMLARHAGIKAKGDFALVHEVWTKLKVDGEMRLCRGYGGANEKVLGVKLNPYWCDRCPVISVPVDKEPNVFKGRAPVKRVADLQYLANDYLNEGADTGHYSAMPIIMTDPEKNPRVSSMVLGLGAMWETSPKDTQFAQFPELWKSALERVAAIKDQIFQSLGVNPSMMPQSSGQTGKKRNQAEIAMEQQVDILVTADMVTNVEEGILTPLLQRFAEYDHQFRDDALTIRMYGDMGKRATMQDVEPIQLNRRFEFRWLGVESARNAAMVQQQIGFLNVLRSIPPMPGYRIDPAPAIVRIAENILGPVVGPLTIVSIKDDLSLDPMAENEMLEHGFDLNVHPADNDPQHLQAHMQALQMGDPHGTIRAHIQKHQVQMTMKTQAQQQQQMGGGGGGDGPKPGASPGQPHAAKGPPGQLHADRMPAAGGVVQMPRKT